MTHMEMELARDRQRSLLAAAAAQRDSQRATRHGRIIRRAERAERLQHSHRDRAARLRARLDLIESGS